MEKIIINEIISRLKLSAKSLGTAKIQISRDLFWARHAIKWNETSFGGWRIFCEKHVNMCRIHINNHITVGAKIDKFGYTPRQCEYMILGLNWCRFKFGLMNQKTKITPAKFIKKYKSWVCTLSGKYEESTDRVYTFSLPADVADKLDSYLKHYGMCDGRSQRGNSTRRGVRDAMIQLVEIQLD